MSVDELLCQLAREQEQYRQDKNYDKANEVQFVISYIDRVIVDMYDSEEYEEEWDHMNELGRGVL